MTARSMFGPKAADHLVKLLGMLGSDHAGERAAAGRKAHEFIRQLGMTWSDVIVHPPAEWQHIALVCRDHAHLLSDRERDFLANIARLRRPPSDKQLDWLLAIYERLQPPQETAA
jgi:hypothetical protein